MPICMVAPPGECLRVKADKVLFAMQRRRKHFFTDPATKRVRPKGWKLVTQRAERVRFLGRKLYPLPSAKALREHCKLPQRVQTKPNRQSILWQFQVKKASRVIPFQ